MDEKERVHRRISELRGEIARLQTRAKEEVTVPNTVGICVDNAGFFGVSYLPCERYLEGSREYLSLVQDYYSKTYLVEYHANENKEGKAFHLHRAEFPTARSLYYVTYMPNFDDVNNIEHYALYLTDEEHCRFVMQKDSHVPGVEVSKKHWKHYYKVVRYIPE